jgi:tetratricopeptide (TPR) repeat protein
LQPISLPDLTAMDVSVRQQIEAQYRALRAIESQGSAPVHDRARAYGDLGSLLLAAQSYDVAEPCYLDAQTLEPGEMRWPYYLGHVYLGRQQPDKAAAAFRNALRLRPGDVATLVWLGTAYLNQGQPDAADPFFTQAASIQPRDASAHLGLGRTALAKREYSRAVDELEQVLTIDPRASIAHYPLSLAYRALGETAKADAHMRERGTTEVGPPDPLMVEVRGLLDSAAEEEQRGIRALQGGDAPAAVTHLRKAVQLAPGNPSSHHELATALSLVGDTRGAIAEFEETLRRWPDFTQAHYSLGVLLAARGRYAEATQHLSAAVAQQPGDVRVRLQLGEVLGRSRQFHKSMVQYQYVLNVDPQLADAQFGYGMSLVGLGRYADARDVLRRGATEHPEQPRFTDAIARLQGLP